MKRTGESLKDAGQILVKTPGIAGKIDTRFLSDALAKAEEQAKRDKHLVAERASKRAEIERLDLSA